MGTNGFRVGDVIDILSLAILIKLQFLLSMLKSRRCNTFLNSILDIAIGLEWGLLHHAKRH